jgi:hypothetical protein
MSVWYCDLSHLLQYGSLALTLLALVLAWYDKTKFSIMVLGLSVLLQVGVTSLPSCASIFDPRGLPVVGQPAH